jgi:hypothetical protein
VIFIISILISDISQCNGDHYQTSAPISLGNMRSLSADRGKNGGKRGERSGGENVRSTSQFINVRNVILSEDSGNSSLNTLSTTSSKKSAKSCDNLLIDGKGGVWSTEKKNGYLEDNHYMNKYNKDVVIQSHQVTKSVMI